MQIEITGRHVEVTEEVNDYVRDKVGKLNKYYDRILEVEVVLDHESEHFSVEMVARADRKHTFVTKETGPDTFALVDLAVEKIGRQLVKHKERNRAHKGRLAADGTSGGV